MKSKLVKIEHKLSRYCCNSNKILIKKKMNTKDQSISISTKYLNMIEDDIQASVIETKKQNNYFATTKSYQMPSLCKVSKLVSIYLSSYDPSNLMTQCELYTSVTYLALKSIDSSNVCLQLNHPTIPIDLQIYLICDFILRIVNFNLKINSVSLLVNKKYNQRMIEDAFYIVQN